jgi:transposase
LHEDFALMNFLYEQEALELLNDAQWELIEPLLPEPKRSKDNRVRPSATNRTCFKDMLWIMRTGSA